MNALQPHFRAYQLPPQPVRLERQRQLRRAVLPDWFLQAVAASAIPNPAPVSPPEIDLAETPPDPRLSKGLKGTNCLVTGFLPWRQCGGVTVIACSEAANHATVQRQLPSTLKPARFITVPRRALHSAIDRRFGSELAVQAETRTAPADSCRDWSTRGMVLLTGLIVALAMALLWAKPQLLALGIFWIAIVTLLANTGLKAACTLIAFRRAYLPAKTIPFQRAVPIKAPLPSISILVPLLREHTIAATLIDRLTRLDYPAELLEICLIVEADDLITRLAVANATLPATMRVITVPTGSLKTKPRAMNYALDFLKGDLIGVYDAEDAPAPDQLRRVARRFQAAGPDLACVQGVLSFYNGHANWISRCFAFEYAGWFRVMLPGLQRLGFAIPLGGTTLFFRRKQLIEMGGWDAHNVTEDADLGMRLARRGYRCEMLETVTQEEANNRLWPWVKQRSRWLKGYAVTWCVHMRSPLKLLRDLGWWKFAGFQLLFLGTLSAFCLAPILWWNAVHMVSAGAIPPVGGLALSAMQKLTILFLTCEAVNIAQFMLAARKLERRPALAWVFTLPVYFTLGTLAAYKGVGELLFRPFYWDKTEHGRSPPA